MADSTTTVSLSGSAGSGGLIGTGPNISGSVGSSGAVGTLPGISGSIGPSGAVGTIPGFSGSVGPCGIAGSGAGHSFSADFCASTTVGGTATVVVTTGGSAQGLGETATVTATGTGGTAQQFTGRAVVGRKKEAAAAALPLLAFGAILI